MGTTMNRVHQAFHQKAKLLLIAPLLWTGHAVANDWEFIPGFEISEAYVENVDFTFDSQEDDFITRIRPSFIVGGGGDRVQAQIASLVDGYYSAKESDRNSVFVNFLSSLRLNSADQRFGLDLNADYGQLVIDATQPIIRTPRSNAENNLADALTVNVAPRWNQSLGRNWVMNSRAELGFVNFTDDDPDVVIDDVDTEEFNWFLGTVEDLDRIISGGVSYLYERQTFDLAREFENEEAGARISYQFAPGVFLEVSGGAQSDLLESTVDGGLGSSFWRAGLNFTTWPKHQLRFGTGEVFFGNTYYFNWDFVGNVLQFSVDYNEDPTTAAELAAGRELRFGADEEVEFGPTPTQTGFGVGDEAQILESLTVRLGAVGTRNSIVVGFFREDFQSLGDESTSKTTEIDISYTRVLGPRMEVILGGRSFDFETDDPLGFNSFEEISYDLSFRRTIARNAAIFASFIHRDIDQNDLLGEQQTFFRIGFQWQPGGRVDSRLPSLSTTRLR